jgi:hypothetical protein
VQKHHLNALTLRRREFPPGALFSISGFAFLVHLTIRPRIKANHIAIERATEKHRKLRRFKKLWNRIIFIETLTLHLLTAD